MQGKTALVYLVGYARPPSSRSWICSKTPAHRGLSRIFTDRLAARTNMKGSADAELPEGGGFPSLGVRPYQRWHA